MSRLKVVSLFSGAGGFDWGLHLASGFETCFANELRPIPSHTLASNLRMRVVSHPRTGGAEPRGVVVQGDVAQVSFTDLKSLSPDVVIGGPPCQDFSVVKGGVRRGVEVKRGRLYSHFVRALAVVQPKVFVFENVPGLMSANNHEAYGMILEDFGNLEMRWGEIREELETDNGASWSREKGYEIVFSGIVDAARLGIPQRRRRLIIIGLRRDVADRVGVFNVEKTRTFIKSEVSGAHRSFAKYPLTSMEVFEGKVICDLGKEYRDAMMAYEGIWDEVGTRVARAWREEVWGELTFDVMKDYMRANKIAASSQSEIDRAMTEHAEVLSKLGYLGVPVREARPSDNSGIAPFQGARVTERIRRIPPDRNNQFVSGTEWQVEGRGMSLIYRRASPLKPAPTVVAYGGGGTWGYHYERERGVLSNRERARLQTFTDDFLFGGTNAHVRAQIGEAVPPLLGERIGSIIKDIAPAVMDNVLNAIV